VATLLTIGLSLTPRPAMAVTTVDQREGFEIGILTGQPHSMWRSFDVPCGSGVTFEVKAHMDPEPIRERTAMSGPTAPAQSFTRVIVVEVYEPNGLPGTDGDFGRLVATRKGTVTASGQGSSQPLIPDSTITITGLSPLNTGCLSPWRVRIHDLPDTDSSLTVEGVIRCTGSGDPALVAMVSDISSLAANDTATSVLTGIGQGTATGSACSPGIVRILARWHTDPADSSNRDKCFKARVELLRPDGSVAASKTGYSQDASKANTPKVDFEYRVKAKDLTLPGMWRVWFKNTTTAVRFVDLGVTKGRDTDASTPAFTSTFTPGCE
jgi:hypothetical protein